MSVVQKCAQIVLALKSELKEVNYFLAISY